MISWPEVVVIGTVALLFFGPKRLPEMARSIGQGIREFKKATQEGIASIEKEIPTSNACPHCHQVLPDGKVQFCPVCGKSLTAPSLS